MNKKDISLVLALFLAFSAVSVYAEEGVTTSVTSETRVQSDDDQQGKPPVKRPLIGEKIKLEVSEIKKEMMDERAGATTTRAEFKAGVLARVEMYKENKDKVKLDLDARMKALATKIAQDKLKIKEARIKLQDASKNRIKGLLKKIYDKLTLRVNVLVEVDGKITDRINELTQTGTSTVAVSAQLLIAQTALAKARTDVTATKTITISETDSETTKDTLRDLVKIAEDSVNDATKEYRKTIELLRPNGNVMKSEKKENATGSTTSTQQ